jgi:hypothetical protein
MIHFQYKGKGILVLVFPIASLFACMLLMKIIDEYFFQNSLPDGVYSFAFSLSFIITGFWNNWVSRDYFINQYGEKEYFYLEHQFMWIEMKYWSYVFWAIGVFGLIGTLANLITK